MSDTDGMLRLMEHASANLKTACADLEIWFGGDQKLQISRQKTLVAMAYARGVLEMVAASVAPEGHKLKQRMIADLKANYSDWAEQNDDVIGMSDGELECIARYLRTWEESP